MDGTSDAKTSDRTGPLISTRPTREASVLRSSWQGYWRQFKQYNYAIVLEPTVHPDKHIWSYQDVEANGQVVAAIMTQLSMKAGTKQWEKPARDACEAEMYQLHMRETFQPIIWEDMTTEQKKKVLQSHSFLKLKRDGTIKARTVAGGNRQRDSSPRKTLHPQQ
jgi:hypothetical protein